MQFRHLLIFYWPGCRQDKATFFFPARCCHSLLTVLPRCCSLLSSGTDWKATPQPPRRRDPSSSNLIRYSLLGSVGDIDLVLSCDTGPWRITHHVESFSRPMPLFRIHRIITRCMSPALVITVSYDASLSNPQFILLYWYLASCW